MIKFDLSVLPKNLSIQKATLHLFTHYALPDVEIDSVYAITTKWNVREVTWINATASTKWNREGIDYDAKKCVLVDCVGDDAWMIYDITEFVNYHFENPDKNFGFTSTLQDIHASNFREYHSSEYKFIEYRPKLIIEHDATDILDKSNQNKLNSNILIKKQLNTVSIYIPYSNCSFYITDLKGRNLVSSYGEQKKWYSFTENRFSNGIYIITIKVDGINAVKKLINIK